MTTDLDTRPAAQDRRAADRWAPLDLATLNIGNADAGPVHDLCLSVAATVMQEGSDRGPLFARLDADPRLTVIRLGHRAGQAATAAVYHRERLRCRRVPAPVLLAADQRVNRGTGPEHTKPKWLLEPRFEHLASGRGITIATWHRVAGQTPKGSTDRDDLAQHEASRVADHYHGHTGLVALGGDTNSRPDDDSLRPLRAAGWKCDQLEDKLLGTHGHWPPDHWWWLPDPTRMRYAHHHTGPDVGSDHLPLVVRFMLNVRRDSS